MLKFVGQLDHDVVQNILFRGYSTPNFEKLLRFLMIFQADFCFLITPTVFIGLRWNLVDS